VRIAGGTYALLGTATGGALQMLCPDNTTWAPVQMSTGAAALTVIAGSLSPIPLPQGTVRLASGNAWLIGMG
jgi:hypothetical protein